MAEYAKRVAISKEHKLNNLLDVAISLLLWNDSSEFKRGSRFASSFGKCKLETV